MEPDNLNKEQDQNSWAVNAWTLLSKLRDQSPLIQCITNFVSMDLMANTLLSAGASPAMIHSIEEIQDFTPHVHALCINVGTLSPAWLPAMREAAQVANKAGKPWVLDPVAAGASSFRLKACLELVGLKPSVIRGNGSEIIALSKASIGATKIALMSQWMQWKRRKSLAQSSGAIVAVSGAVDIITDGHRVVGAHNGSLHDAKDHGHRMCCHCPYCCICCRRSIACIGSNSFSIVYILALLERWEWPWPKVLLH
ncbi:hypothetical protein OIU76_003619 [Salix suchowensis]|nr:hypothetical protein OIU76_003619 [Salix suchowensis]